MTMFQSDLMPHTYYSTGDCGLEFGPESDFDLMTRKVHLFVGVVPVVCCSLRIDCHLAADLPEGERCSHRPAMELADYQICCRSAVAGYSYSENRIGRLPDLILMNQKGCCFVGVENCL